MVKTKKHRLLLEPDRDYHLTAIASHEKGYHLSWILNRKLGTYFTRSTDFHISRKNTDLFFPVFIWKDEKKMLTWHLISNRSENGFLLNELKNIDFLLHITPNPGEEFIRNLQNHLKNIPVVYTCFPLNPEKYQAADSLQFD
ncbi:MAG TPA: IPExxxVDY family protein [Bacteroidetes bacterium]|nr:IPExxxVDY family protein [Bacteroidota bacterium]